LDDNTNLVAKKGKPRLRDPKELSERHTLTAVRVSPAFMFYY
jgi:hypothetical protein